MAYDLAAVQRELADRIAWLIDEVDRLRTENERLAEQNRELREEVTLGRVLRDMEDSTERRRQEALYRNPSELPPEAMHLFYGLPEQFSFSQFFRIAEKAGLSAVASRDYLLYFLRERMLSQSGARIRKIGSVPVSAN